MVPRAQPAEIPRVHTELTWDTVDTWDSIWKLAHAALNESPTGFMTIPQITHAIAIRNTTRFDVVNPKPLKSSLSNNLTLSADFDRFKTPGIRLSSWYLTGSQRGVERPDKKRARQQAKAAKGKRRSTRGAEAAQPTNEQPQASSSHAHLVAPYLQPHANIHPNPNVHPHSSQQPFFHGVNIPDNPFAFF